MGRTPRVEFQGATYHVFSRGNRREKIFLEREDYEAYREDLRVLAAREGVAVIAFCLMPNHPHLCVQTNGSPLSEFMHRLNTRHARRFNLKYQTEGHLHSGRYKALLVEEDLYLLRLVRYIHQNPVRAGLTKDPSEWEFSSYGLYLQPQSWISRDLVLARLGSEQFEPFMRAPPSEDDHGVFSAAKRGFRVAGTPDFSEEIRGRLRIAGADLRRWAPSGNLESGVPAETEAARWLELHGRGLRLEDLLSPARNEPLRTIRRELAVHLSALLHTQAEICRVLGRESPSVSRLLTREFDRRTGWRRRLVS